MRRGQASRYFVLFIFFIALALSISALLVIRTNELRDPANYQKDFLAKDLALLADLLIGLDYDFQLRYDSLQDNHTAFTYSLDSTLTLPSGAIYPLDGPSVIVNDDQGPRYYQYLSREGSLEANTPVSFPDPFLYYIKEGDNFDLRVNPIVLSGSLDCTLSSDYRYSSFALDPGHGSEGSNIDEGFTGSAAEISEAAYTWRLARFISGSETAPSHILTRGGDTLDDYQPVSQRVRRIQEQNPGAVLSFHVGDYVGDPALKAYVPAGEYFEASSSLACRLLNSILHSENDVFSDITRAAIIPVSETYLSEEDPLQVLFTQRPGVQLEIGSVNVENSFQRTPFPVSQAILSVMQEVSGQ